MTVYLEHRSSRSTRRPKGSTAGISIARSRLTCLRLFSPLGDVSFGDGFSLIMCGFSANLTDFGIRTVVSYMESVYSCRKRDNSLLGHTMAFGKFSFLVCPSWCWVRRADVVGEDGAGDRLT